MKIIKNFLMFICGVFCFIGLTACKDEEEPTKVEMTKQEFYEKLLVLNSKMDDVSQYTVTGEMSVSMFMYSEKSSYKISVDLDNSKYASIEKDKDGNVTNSEYVITNGNDHIKYTYEKDYFDDEDVYGAYYVGSDYIPKSMEFNENMIDIKELDMNSYETFCESFDEMLVESSEDLEGLDLDSIDTKVEMYKENGVYHFTYSVSYSVTEDDGSASASISATMKFNDDFLVGLDMDMSMIYSTPEGKITTKMKNSNQYSKGFDNAMIPMDFSSYPQDIENAEFEVYYVLDGQESSFGKDYVYMPDETFAPDYLVEEIDNTYLDGWYLDKDCTISVDTLTDYPSYDLYLYANTKPNENYALIILEETVTAVGEWIFGPEVTKLSVEAGSEFVIPTEVEVYGNEGVVDSVTVNGIAYTESKLTVENGKVYRINISATETND